MFSDAFFYREYTLIKRLLLTASIFFIIMPFVWIAINDYTNTKTVNHFISSIGKVPINLAFENLTVKTYRENNDKLNLVAPNARIKDLKFSTIILDKPEIKILQPNNEQTQLIAHQGSYISNGSYIRLNKGIKIIDHNHYEMLTEELTVNLNDLKIKLPKGVNASFYKHNLKANDVDFDYQKNRATFKGGVKLVIKPDA